MKQWTVVWQNTDDGIYEYSYIQADEPMDFSRGKLFNGVQFPVDNRYQNNTSIEFEIIYVAEGHVGVNFP